jgi:hypothetical protein
MLAFGPLLAWPRSAGRVSVDWPASDFPRTGNTRRELNGSLVIAEF